MSRNPMAASLRNRHQRIVPDKREQKLAAALRTDTDTIEALRWLLGDGGTQV
jgi:hypothetical protein